MNVPQWISGLFGIEKTAEAIVLKSETYLVMDPMASGNAEEKSRPVTIHMAKENMNGGADVVVYWTKTLKEIFKKSYEDQKTALHAYSETADKLKEIDELINDGDTEKAKKASETILETLELDGKKNELSQAIEKEESVVIDGVGVYRAASKTNAVPGFEFNDTFIVKAMNPTYVGNTLPSYFLENTPVYIYSTYTKPHIARENFTGTWYSELKTNDSVINNVAVMERSKDNNGRYYVIENCSEDKFVKLCRLVTPTYEDFNLKFSNGKVTRIAENAEYVDAKTPDYNKLASDFMTEFRAEGRDNRHLPHAVNHFAYTKGVDADLLMKHVDQIKSLPENKDTRKYDEMNLGASLNVEAKGKKKERNMLPEPNEHSSGRDEWRLDQGAQRPTEVAMGFYTPLIVAFNNDVGTYEVQFENGRRNNLNVDAVKTYLYNAGFTYKDVADILEDAKKDEVAIYGKKHKKAAELAHEIVTIMKLAENQDAAYKYVDSLSMGDAEKKDVKAILGGMYKQAKSEKTCANCAHFSSDESGEILECHKIEDVIDTHGQVAYSWLKNSKEPNECKYFSPKDGTPSGAGAEKKSEPVESKNFPAKEASQDIELAAKVLKDNHKKINTFAKIVDECYRNGIIKKELYDAFYKTHHAALTDGNDTNWRLFAETAESVFNQMKSNIDKSAAIDQDELARGVEIETKEHNVPEVVGAGIAAQHTLEHENYYNEEDGLTAFEKQLEEKSKEVDNGDKASS